MRPAGGIDEDALRTGSEERSTRLDARGPGGARAVAGRGRGRQMDGLPGGSRRRRDDGDRLLAAVLHDIGIDRVDEGRQMLRRRVRDDGDDARTTPGRRRVADDAARSAASPISSARGVPATRLRPIASAPARTAARAPATSVTPQIFTSGRRATFAGSSGVRPGRHEGASDGRRIRRPHERLADERAVEPERSPSSHGLSVAHPGLGDDEAVVRHEIAEAIRPVRCRHRASAGRGC